MARHAVSTTQHVLPGPVARQSRRFTVRYPCRMVLFTFVAALLSVLCPAAGRVYPALRVRFALRPVSGWKQFMKVS
jgi:hypothetical protein